VSFHLEPVARTLPGLLRDPFALDLGIEFLHGIVDTPVMRLGFRQMLIGIDASERTNLEALTRKPIEPTSLAMLPETTLGGAYSRFFERNGFDPDFHARTFPACLEDLRRDWIFARFARLHDLHHVLLGLNVTPPHELALHLFLFVNCRDPVSLAFTLGMPFLAPRYLRMSRFLAESRKLVGTAGAIPNLFRFPYEECLTESLVDLRTRVGLPPDGCPVRW